MMDQLQLFQIQSNKSVTNGDTFLCFDRKPKKTTSTFYIILSKGSDYMNDYYTLIKNKLIDNEIYESRTTGATINMDSMSSLI